MRTPNEFWENRKEMIRERSLMDKPPLPTGIEYLDNLTDGIREGKLTVLAGAPGSGKTALGLQICRNMVDTPDTKALFISLEMTGEELVGRMFCEMNEIDYSAFRKGDIISNFKNYNEMFEKYLQNIELDIVDDKGYTFSEVKSIVKERYGTEHQPDVIFIDYLQLISKRDHRDERAALDEFLRSLVELAKKTNIAIVLLSQLNREGQKDQKEPDMTDLKGSGAIEQEAFVVIFVYKERKVKYGKETVRVFIKVAKNREGPVGKKEFLFFGKHFKFQEKRFEIETGSDGSL
jgi:replicative DNA helicase